jgi:hypothetical protein
VHETVSRGVRLAAFACECSCTVLCRTGVKFFGCALLPSAAINMAYQVAIIYSKEGESE